MPLEWKATRNLTLGVNYRNLVATRNSREGEASDCLNVLPREDGSIYKAFGWLRRNPTALTGRPVAMKGFTYRGKNIDATDTARPGNWGVANDGATFTRRVNEYPGFLLLTTTNAYVWDPINEAFLDVTASVPGSVTIVQETKPTIVIAQDNCYIVGWADKNLRFDPTDHAFYLWGWEQTPASAPTKANIAGDLITSATYKYAVSFIDIYTGEESKMGDFLTATGSGGYQINTAAISYTGSRHYNLAAGTVKSDVSTVIWRTGADDESPRFLAILDPGTTTFNDDGVARETSLRPFRGTQQDEPRFSALHLFKGRFYALSKQTGSNRVYYSAFDKNPYFERWLPLDYRDLEVPDGEVLTALGGTDATLLVFAQRSCFRISVSLSVTQQQIVAQQMPWHVGCVGPGARHTVDGWEYFLSERGPYRWREGRSAPDEIGENLLPIFVDPVSGLCKLAEEGRELSEVNFDWVSNTVRFTFPTGNATFPNRHMAYWILADRVNGDDRLGWFPQSPQIQAMDQTGALTGNTAGLPNAPRAKKPPLVFADQNGYVYEYGESYKRAGLDAAEPAVTTVSSTAGATITVPETLPTAGDGLKGLRLELESQPDANGNTTVEVYEILSNTANIITITAAAFSRTPIAGDAVRIAGIHAFWRSWVDHLGQPHQHKTLMDFSLGYQDRNNPDGSITVNIGAGEFPDTFSATETATMDKYRRKMTVSKTAVFFNYEFANSIPDELFLITDFEREVSIVPGRRLA